LNLRRNIIILITLFFCVGIFVSERLVCADFNYVLYLTISIIILLIISLIISRNKIFFKLTFSLLIVSLSAFLTHEINQTEINSSLIYLDKQTSCKGIIDEVSQTKSGNTKLIIKVNEVFNDQNKSFDEFKVLAYPDKTIKNLKVGDALYFKTEINKFKYFGNPWEFDFGKYNLRKGIIGFVFLKKENLFVEQNTDNSTVSLISSKLNYELSSILTGQELEVCKAFLWGERVGVSDDVMNAFVNTGTIHILAVSGLHIGILFSIIIYFFRFFSRWISKKQATVIAILIAWGYAWITGFSPSILRSVIVFTLIFINDILEKKRNEIVLMSLSALFLLIYDTNYLFDLGFQLTYAALIGIYVFYPFLSKIFNVQNRVVNYFYAPLMVGFSAQLTTLPIILYNFHQFPNYFTFANLFLVPFSFLIIVLGVGFYLFSFSIFLKSLIGFLLKYVLKAMISIVLFFDKLPFSVAKQFVFSDFDFIFFVILLILLFVIFTNKNKRLLGIFCFMSICFICNIQLKRYRNIQYSYLSKVGGVKDVYLATNNNSYIVVYQRAKPTSFVFKNLKVYFQKNTKLFQYHRNSILKVNYINVENLNVFHKNINFQLLKKL
jgi:competence protein ComEC